MEYTIPSGPPDAATPYHLDRRMRRENDGAQHEILHKYHLPLAQAAADQHTASSPKRSKLPSSASNQKASIMSTAQSPISQGSRPQPTSTSEGPLGTFGILNVQSRVMTPPRSLPLENFPLEETLIDEVFGNEVKQKAFEVASQLSLRNSIAWVKIISRVSRYDPQDSLPTLLIVMNDWATTSPGPWQTLVEEMKKYIGMSASGISLAFANVFSVTRLSRWTDCRHPNRQLN